MAAELARLRGGGPVLDRSITLSQYLERWLTSKVDLKDSTHSSYAEAINLYFKPGLDIYGWWTSVACMSKSWSRRCGRSTVSCRMASGRRRCCAGFWTLAPTTSAGSWCRGRAVGRSRLDR